MRNFLLGAIVLLLSACSQKAEDLDTIETQCKDGMSKGDEFCDCLIAQAEKELTETQIAFIAAGFEKNKERIEELNEELGFEGAIAAGVFMAKSVTACAVK